MGPEWYNWPWSNQNKGFGHRHIWGRWCTDSRERWPSTSWGKRPRAGPFLKALWRNQPQTLLTSWSWTSSLQNHETINFCHLSPPICAIFFPDLANENHNNNWKLDLHLPITYSLSFESKLRSCPLLMFAGPENREQTEAHVVGLRKH